jgi:hypothetical protein
MRGNAGRRQSGANGMVRDAGLVNTWIRAAHAFTGALALMGALVVGGSSGAMAQGDTGTIGLGIRAYSCDRAADAEANLANCDLLDGLTVDIFANGVNLGSCTTEIGMVRDGELAFCAVDALPFNQELVIEARAGAIPAGFRLLVNPQTLTLEPPPADSADYTPMALFVAVPTGASSTGDEDTVAETVQLPATGSGSTSAQGRLAWWPW